ncbi:efflux RND transporter permease subunit [bacterium]|jgi:hydrophobic/amphiphilic exporter-1 (mainly G- bacteria), HAE1 family|nr:efflux RND transporter permease subunit [bacterium]MBT5401650.1 efflux RND transporter permease subunit [bacterium]MBT5942389.1 efflux RND transporter permease subunit [bacterium]MBT6068026.1 efflux RND transporter permease subunit [bacterium]MBT6335960.1 efflux RND transporter permease subunit [bacterium]
MEYQEHQPTITQEQRIKAARKFSNSFFGFFIKNFRFSYIIILAILIAGAISLSQLPREAEPEIVIPIGVVTTIYPGASPNDVEELITDELEKEFKSLDDVKTITSSSGLGVSSVVVEFMAEADYQTSIRKLKDATDTASPNLPDEAEDPIVIEIRNSDFPIITFSLAGDFSQSQLNAYAETIQDELKKISNINKVNIMGKLDTEFSVKINKEKLEGFDIDLNSVVSQIGMLNNNFPIGNVTIDDVKYQIRLEGKISEVQELNTFPIGNINNTVIYLSDVADITEGFKEQNTKSRLSLNGEKANPTISLQVYKKPGGNIISIIEEAKETVKELEETNVLPQNLKVLITGDNAKWVAEDLNRLGNNAIITIVLIFIILTIFMGYKQALIAGLAIPLTFLSAFFWLNMQGQTLNSMVLFSLVLGLGLLVDTAIVIIEGIHHNITDYKLGAYDSALYSVKVFKWPLIAGTMTTVFAFLPMLLVSGVMGEYMGIIPKTVSAVLLSSLFISLTLVPAIAYRSLKWKHDKTFDPRSDDDNNKCCDESKLKSHNTKLLKKITKFKARYEKYLRDLLPNKKKRRKLILTMWLLFAVAMLFPITGILKIEMFPKVDVDYFVINIKAAEGSTLEVTEKIVEDVEAILYGISDVDNFVTSIGTSQSIGTTDFFGGGSSNTTHLANITVNLKDSDLRDKVSYVISDEVREKLKQITNADTDIIELGAGPPSGSPVEVRILGDKIEELDSLANQIMEKLKNIEGTQDVKKSLKEASGEFVLTPNKEILGKYGLNSLSLAFRLRQAIYGVDASEISRSGEDIKIRVSYNKEKIKDFIDLNNSLITTPTGVQVPLGILIKEEFKPSFTSINHKDNDRIVYVNSNVENDYTAADIFKELQKEVDVMNLPQGYKISMGGELEDIEKSYREIFYSFIISIILIAGILVLQFNSFRQPFIILFTLPLALIGVFGGLALIRLNFSLPAFIGIVGLSGIVVNDAIILIDRINTNLKNKMPFYEAIIDAGMSRMQPIFLTTITTIAGILPLGLSDEVWAGLAFSIVFGLAIATVLTLVVVPVLFVSLEGKRLLKEEATK